MLIACPSCHRQYDVGSHPPGSVVRCMCGHLCRVGAPRARQVEMLHCSNCGGRLESGKDACAYCSAEVRLADRGLGPACPECLVTTFAGVKHCHACGVRIDPEVVLRVPSALGCPRCGRALSECQSSSMRYFTCTACGGIWLQEELFARITESKSGALAALLDQRARTALPAPAPEPAVRYLPCPECKELMNRRNFAGSSGIILDWCRGHGWWFDSSELERVLVFIEAGGLERSLRAQHERRVQELRNQEERLRRSEPVPSLPLGPVRTRWNLLEALAGSLFAMMRDE